MSTNTSLTSGFDEIINRRDSGAMKWQRYPDDVLPLWVADSDFKCAPAIIDGLHRRVEHGIFGYHAPGENHGANQAVVVWLKKRYNWVIAPEWLVWVPGVISAFNLACQTLAQPGQKVLVQSPNYKPLLMAPANNQQQCVTVATVLKDDRWVIDFEQLEREAADPDCTLLLLCNPMNPCGSVLTPAELALIESICLAHNVAICSDEIHCDLILDNNCQHVPAGSLEAIGEQTITLMAASKSFNIAGLGAAFAVIPDNKIRHRFQKAMQGHVPWVNHLGVLATEIAFTQCDDWYFAQLEYLRANRDYLVEQLNTIPGFHYRPAQATFLAWLDCNDLGVADVQGYFLNKKIAPSAGSDFGWPYFSRINFACPRQQLITAIQRLRND